jgi:hypothetical protein
MSDSLDTTPQISADERAKRQRAIDFARGSVRFEGLIPSPEGEQINQRFISGKITIQEALAEVETLGSQHYGR